MVDPIYIWLNLPLTYFNFTFNLLYIWLNQVYLGWAFICPSSGASSWTGLERGALWLCPMTPTCEHFGA